HVIRSLHSIALFFYSRHAARRRLHSFPTRALPISTLLLLDEPLGALDLKLRKAMQLELKQLQERIGITFIYVTHDQEEALTMSEDRKSTRLNSSHVKISYAVFCLKKKKKRQDQSLR